VVFEWFEDLIGNGMTKTDTAKDASFPTPLIMVCNCLTGQGLCLGWVDVRWENGSANSYRMGAGGHIDLDILPESRTMGPREILAAMRQRGKGLMSGVPAPRKTSEGHSLASSFSLRARATDSLKKKIGSGSGMYLQVWS